MLVCCISFIASALTWGERPSSPNAEAVPASVPDDVKPADAVPVAPARTEPSAATAEPTTVAAPPTQPRALPAPSESGTTVLRCKLRGRVTYADPSAACPDGASAKLTVLPR